jgi:hypothetical protein
MSSLFDLIYSQTQPSQVPEEPPTASSLPVAATPLPSALKTYSQFTDVHEQTSTRTGRKHLSVQFIDQTKHRPRSLLRDLDQYSSTEDETDQSGNDDDLEDNDDEESGKEEGDALSPKTKKKKRFVFISFSISKSILYKTLIFAKQISEILRCHSKTIRQHDAFVSKFT